MRHYWRSKGKGSFCAVNFTRTQQNRNGAIDDYWREFIGSRSIVCARRFSRFHNRIFIAFCSHGSVLIRNTGSKDLKVCYLFSSTSTGARFRCPRVSLLSSPLALPTTTPNVLIVFVFPAGLAGDV